VRINHHQGDNRINFYGSDIFSSKQKFGNNTLSQIRGDLEELAQGKGIFTLQ
jgi:hypothetical protein